MTELSDKLDKSLPDVNCPLSSWMGEDLNHCPGIGEWKCLAQKYEYASDQYGIDSMDYRKCECKDHTNCAIYRKNSVDK